MKGVIGSGWKVVAKGDSAEASLTERCCCGKKDPAEVVSTVIGPDTGRWRRPESAAARDPAWLGRLGGPSSSGLIGPASVTPASQGAMERSACVGESRVDEVDACACFVATLMRRARRFVGESAVVLTGVAGWSSPSEEAVELDVEGNASPGLDRISAGGSVKVGERRGGVYTGRESDRSDWADAEDEVRRWC